MQATPKDYWLSGLVAGLGLVAMLVGFIVMLLLPSIRFAAWGTLALGVILLAAAFIMDFRRVSRALTGRRARFGVSSMVMASIFIGIILFANAISIGNYHRFDVTGLSQFTLTSKTQDILANLEAPVEVVCFFVPSDPNGTASYATSLLNAYQNYTDKISVRTVDPDEHPDEARQYGMDYLYTLYSAYGLNDYQTLIFESQGQQRVVSSLQILSEAEHAFTSAILEVTGTVQKKVYFLTGHGEADISSNYSYVEESLRDNLYKVGTLDLVATPQMPDDCATLVIAGAQEPLSSSELEIINQYLDEDGRLLVLLNPYPPQEINQLLSPWEIKVEDGMVIDESSYVAPNKQSPRVPRTRSTFGLSGDIYFPESTAIIPVESTEESAISLIPLAYTSSDSWLERNYVPDAESEFDEGTDVKGPLVLAVLVSTVVADESREVTDENIHLVVVGDSDFASNQHFNNGSNGDFFISAVNYLTIGQELIEIERKVLPFRRLVVGPEAMNFITYSSIALLPLLVLVAGGIIWWRRR
ncbi:Gldg family protein [Chloroflexota bacterium]